MKWIMTLTLFKPLLGFSKTFDLFETQKGTVFNTFFGITQA